MSLDPNYLIASYGYWAIALVVGLESIGVPLPGETILIAAAIYAGTTHHLEIGLVVLAAISGAIIGDSIGFWIGRELGFRLLLRYGRYVSLGQPRLKLGQYLFYRYGGTIVFFGRFVALLRTMAALLAGANQMPWPRFLLFNAAGGIVWASLFGFGTYALGASIHRLSGALGIVLLIMAAAAAIAGFIFVRYNEARLLAEAEKALPGPLRRKSGPAGGA